MLLSFIITVVIVAMVYGLWQLVVNWLYWDIEHSWFLSGVFAILIVIAMLSFPTAWLIIGALSEKSEVIVRSTRTIYTMSDNSSVSGRIFLGSGYIGEHTYYHYYTRDAKQSYSLNSVRTGNAEVYEDGEDDPHIEYLSWEITSVCDLPRFLVWPVPVRGDVYRRDIHCSPQIDQPCIRFHIPEGSVARRFVLDADM